MRVLLLPNHTPNVQIKNIYNSAQLFKSDSVSQKPWINSANVQIKNIYNSAQLFKSDSVSQKPWINIHAYEWGKPLSYI